MRVPAQSKMVLCGACGASLKRSGLVQHCRISTNPACLTFLMDLWEATSELLGADQPDAAVADMLAPGLGPLAEHEETYMMEDQSDSMARFQSSSVAHANDC